MTRKSHNRRARDRAKLPDPNKVMAIHVDEDRKQAFFVTNDILVNQIQREGPKIAKSFDQLAAVEMLECSKILGRVIAILMRHLPDLDDKGSRATIARLLLRSQNGLMASIETARHGFPHEVGVLGRSYLELLATAVSIALNPDVLKQFHDGTLDSTKCIGWANKAIPIFGKLNGILSKNFVHIKQHHSLTLIPKPYEKDDGALIFVTNTLLILFWILGYRANLC